VLDLRLGGDVRVMVATRDGLTAASLPAGVTAGPRIAYRALLNEEPRIGVAYTPGTGPAAARSLPVSVGIPLEDIWAWVMARSRMVAGWGEAYLIADGVAYENRLVILRGDIDGGASFGASGENLDVELVDPQLSADLAITEYIADTDRLSDVPDTSVGQRYPLAINAPVGVPLMRTTATTPPTWMVSVGHEHTVTVVRVDGVSYGSGSPEYPWAVNYLSDAKGAPYTAVVFSSGTGAWDDTTAVHADLAIRTDVDTVPLRNVIDTIRYLLEQWSALGPTGVSDEVFARAGGKVPDKIGPRVYINGSGSGSSARAMQYVEQTICACYPMISMVWQIGGYGPVVTDRRAPSVAKWIVGQGPVLSRVGDWQETPKSALFNWITVRYDYDPVEDVYRGVVHRDPTNSLICQISEEQAGPRDRDPIETPLIGTAGEATWVADWLVEHQAIPSYDKTYEGEPGILVKYRLGDNVDLVDEKIHGVTLAAPVKATIIGIERVSRSKVEVRLRIWALYPNLGGGARASEGAPPIEAGQ